ncbi:MAG: hypothetical protein ACK52I_09270 [Pseudomonadota bacterium]
MRRFKRFHGNVDDFVPIAVVTVDLELQRRLLIPKLLGLGSVGIGVDLFEESQIEQTVLLIPMR